MARVFITGSADGLGKMAGELLLSQGHHVVFHARNAQRAKDLKIAVPRAENILVGDLTRLKDMKSVADQANRLGTFDAVIHNAAVGYQEPKSMTEDGLPHVFAVNSLAPYVLTSLMNRPKRLIYMSSGLHQSGAQGLDDLLWKKRSWSGIGAYSESKFHDALLAFSVARLWKDVYSNSLEPGWVPTKMGGAGAPDDLTKGFETQAWLAVSEDRSALVSGEYFYHKKLRTPHPATRDVNNQNSFLSQCREISGVELKES